MLDVIGFKQSDDSRCGPSAIKSILYYYGIDATEDEITKQCNHTYELGCTNEDMVKALEYYGLSAKIYENSRVEHLRYWVRHKIPPIVDWFSQEGHSSIIVDVDKYNVYLLDPEDGKQKIMNIRDFELLWFDWANTPIVNQNTKMEPGVMIITYAKQLDK